MLSVLKPGLTGIRLLVFGHGAIGGVIVSDVRSKELRNR